MQNRFQTQLHRQKSHDYDPQDSGFAAAVAATAFAIYSLEEQEADNQRRMKEEFKMSKIGTGERKVDITTGSGKVTRRISSTKIKDAGETSSRQRMEQDQKMKESTLPSRRTSRSLSTRNSAGQRQKGNSTGRDVVETKAESWEKTRLQKLNKRYDKMKSDILAWENAKKMQTKLSMERKEKELEIRRMANLRHYQNKLARIDLIAEGARRQLEEKRINEESKLKGKEKYMKSKGRSPINCFCC